jgi:cytochrome P450
VTTSELVFDPFSPAFYNDPYPIYRRMQDEAPVYYNAEYDFYALTRHADVAPAFKDYETYSSAKGIDLATIKSGELPDPPSVIFMDPPDHRYMRSLVNKVFTPRAMESQRQMVVGTIDRYAAALDPDEFDVVADFSGPFPVDVITQMLGVPEEYRQQVRHWIDEALRREPGNIGMTETGLQAAIENGLMYYNLVQERRKDPRDDMISGLIAAEVMRENGEKRALDDIEIASFVSLLGGAGAETVTKLIGNAVTIFARHLDQWREVRDDRSKVAAAVEEVLRFEAPSQYNVRFSMKEVTLHGVTIPAGKPVFLCAGAANRDPEAFTNAGSFDINRDRTEAQNLGFGYGIHSCLGAALARMEGAVALDRLLDLMPGFEVKWDRCKRVEMINVAGWSNVPVRVIR